MDCRWRTLNFRPILEACSLSTGRGLYRGTPAVTFLWTNTSCSYIVRQVGGTEVTTSGRYCGYDKRVVLRLRQMGGTEVTMSGRYWGYDKWAILRLRQVGSTEDPCWPGSFRNTSHSESGRWTGDAYSSYKLWYIQGSAFVLCTTL
jgi:hypothetical protein